MLGRKIVVVSDDWTITDLWSQNMKGNSVGVDLVGFGALSSWLDTVHRYDLAIVDINDCEEAGADVCRELRAASRAPVLVLTYDRDERTQLTFYSTGVDECIVKPIGMPLLLAKVKAWLERSAVNGNGPSRHQRVGNKLESRLTGVN